MTAVGYGIDFGTTNSSIAIAYPDHIEIVEIDPGARELHRSLPSLEYLHRAGTRAAGANAARSFMVTGSQRHQCQSCNLVQWDSEGGFSECKQFSADGSCVDSRLISGLKDEFANTSFERTHSWAVDFSLPDLAAIVMGDLKERADRIVGRSVDRVVLGHPIAFQGAEGEDYQERQDLAIERLYETAELVGFREIAFMPEPAAAMLDEPLPDGVSISVDFGGGTFDVAAIDVADGEGETVALRGTGVGGSMFDAMLFDHVVHDELGLNRQLSRGRPVPRWFAQGLRNLQGVRELLNNPQTPAIVGELRNVGEREAALLDQILFNGQAYPFYRAIEEAKINLSNASEATIDFRPPGIRGLSIPIQRRELDQLIRRPLDRIDAEIDAALEDAGVDARDVQAVIRTGGSSRLGAFVERLERRFGPNKIRTRDAYASVAQGLALVAQEEWA